MNLPPPEVCDQIRALHVLLGASNGKDRRDDLLKLLAENRLSWNDLPELFSVIGSSTVKPLPRDHICESIAKIHAQIGSLNRDGQIAQDKLIKLLAKRNLSWSSDLPAILAAVWTENNPVTIQSNAAAAAVGPEVDVFELNRALIEDRVVMKPAECVVAILWALNTFVYDQFEYASHLGFISPSSGCGKSTSLKTLKRAAARPWYSHNVTAPAIYRKLRRMPRASLFLDEAENQNILHDQKLRAVLDAAFESDGSVDLVEDGESIKFPVFAPIAWAMQGFALDFERTSTR